MRIIFRSKKTTSCTRLDCCIHLRKSCLHNPCPQRWGSDSVAPCSPALLLTKAGDVKSNPGPTTHTNKHTPVIWICDLCHKQINKKQTSIRCNHTKKHTLNCTHIKQQQYKPDWRCTIHTPTQNITTTLIRETLSYPGPTKNKQMSHATLIFKQNRRGQTPITTVSSL